MNIRTKNESGVTLLMAIMILAVVTFLSFSISTIILREIGAAQVSVKSEPAIAAAYAGGEVGIYKMVRQKSPIDETGTALEQSGGTYSIASELYDYPYVFSIPAPGGGHHDESRYLFDASDFNNLNADYGTVTVKNSATSPALFSVTVYSLEDPENPICPETAKLNQGQSTNPCVLYDPTGQGDDRYQLVFSWEGNQAIAGEITATDNSGNPKGVPSDVPKLNVTGTNGNVQRVIKIDLSSS